MRILELLALGLILWLVSKFLGSIGQGLGAVGEHNRDELHDLECEVAEMLADEPDEAWKAHGLDKAVTLDRCGITRR